MSHWLWPKAHFHPLLMDYVSIWVTTCAFMTIQKFEPCFLFVYLLKPQDSYCCQYLTIHDFYLKSKNLSSRMLYLIN